MLHEVSLEILVVDDGSTDGTPAVAEELAASFPVRVIRRVGIPGLSRSVIEGFQFATGEIVVVMDADLSHPPQSLLEMIVPILDGRADATVSSRYISGGGCEGWSVWRQIISRGSGLLARGFTHLSDPTTGFMAIRKNLFEGVELNPIGWKIVLEVITKTKPRLIEVPIIFRDRLHGESKANFGVMLDYMKHLWSLYDFSLPRLLEFVKFCLVGVSGLVVDSVALFGLVEMFKIQPLYAVALSFSIAVTWNFFLNRSWTFRAGSISLVTSYSRFVIVCLGGLGIRLLIMSFLFQALGMANGHWYLVANVIGIGVATVVNFLGSRYLAFRDNR